jgi:hypothetical protein
MMAAADKNFISFVLLTAADDKNCITSENSHTSAAEIKIIKMMRLKIQFSTTKI